MILRDSLDDSSRFEGDRALRWRSIPANARIVSAKVTVTPVDAKLGIDFGEVLSFDGGPDGFGATKAAAVGSTAAWVEVDFHGRRTLARAAGTFSQTFLQVDVGGGTYVEINKFGAFKTPDDDTPAKLFQLDGSSSPLPGLTVTKVKLTNNGATAPELNSVTIVSLPANVSLRVGDLSPFWTHVGEMTKPETTPDFTAVLEAALITAKVENGFYDLPITIHSDTIARLQVDLEVEFLVEQKPLPNGLPEVVLPFDYSSLPPPQSSAATINVIVPPNTRVVAGQTTARVKGAFAETRIAKNRGPTGEVTPAAAVEVSPACTQAQCIEFTETDDEVAATAIDLLIEATTPAARLRLEIRGDLDGKPDDASLLPGTAELSLDQRAVKGPRWASVPLPAEFVFEKPEKGSKRKRYWLVLQSLVGGAAWSADEATSGALNMLCTRDSGHSWRDTVAMSGTLRDQAAFAAGPFAAFFRLREKPKTFKVPIQLQVGASDKQVRVELDRFEPLGRVDFSLDTELAQGINQYLEDFPAKTCPETEHLINPDFEQWQKVGDNVVSRPAIEIDSTVIDVAFSPDGTLAYVLGQTDEQNLLLAIDVACGQIREKMSLSINPKAFAISPDGKRAYVTDGSSIQVVNLATNQALAAVFDLKLSELPVNDLAVSPDGTRLYMASLIISTVSENVIRVIDTAKLEQQLTTGLNAPGLLDLKKVQAGLGQPVSPIAIAVSPDGSLLYMILQLPGPNGAVQIIDTATFPTSVPITVAGTPKAIALTPDGKRAIIVNGGTGSTGNVSVIETAARTPATIHLDLSPIDVAVSPDGTRAYVLSDNSISVIDLSKEAVTNTFPVILGPTTAFSPTAVALAMSPQGDQIYAAHNGAKPIVSPIQFGTRRPAEWQITSGVVNPFCLPPPFHLVAVLGPDAKPSAMSQVAPVAESCTYEFSFRGIAIDSDANEPPAMAEVLWLSRDCGLVRADQVPIKLLEIPPVSTDASGPGAVRLAAGAARETASLELHRVRLTAPAGVDQAEVRFTAPSGATAVIDQVSLIATSEAVANSDFALEENGRLASWTLEPALAPGFAVLKVDGETQLRNAGAATAELVQTAPAKSGQPFTFEIQGNASAGSTPQKTPRAALHWLDGSGGPAGSPTVIEILADGLSSSVGSGTSPEGAAQAEIHLIVPGGTTQVVRRVSLRFSTPATVPVTFIAEAPGELTVSDVRVAFEQLEASAPPVPDRGLCIPTPPGCEPGESSADSCFCHQCESEQIIVEKNPVLTSAARPGVTGNCATCGTKLLRSGGPRVAGAEPFSNVATSIVTQPRVIRSAIARTETVRNSESSAPIPLTELSGIGVARARQLAEIGIDSVEKLAASTPEVVAQIKFLTVEMATRLVLEAKAAGKGSNQ